MVAFGGVGTLQVVIMIGVVTKHPTIKSKTIQDLLSRKITEKDNFHKTSMARKFERRHVVEHGRGAVPSFVSPFQAHRERREHLVSDLVLQTHSKCHMMFVGICMETVMFVR